MKTLIQTLQQWLKKLGAWLSGDSPKAPPPDHDPDSPSPFSLLAVQAESKPPLRLKVGELGIFVSCASCGVLHELDAVCHLCGAALCSDTLNCRRSLHSNQLVKAVYTCPICEQTLHKN